MSWRLITDSWRLKLLAIGLAVLMLGAVAFSQNPPTSGSVTVNVVYTPGQGIVLIKPPSQLKVYYQGPADAVQKVNASNTVAKVDASKAQPGPAVSLPVSVSSTLGGTGLIFQAPPPIVVQIDARQGKDLNVVVNARAAPGWSINEQQTYAECAPKPNPCQVHFDGPASWESNMTAIVSVPSQVNYTGPSEILNLTVQLQNANGFVDLTCKTIPCATLDVVNVNVRVVASQGSTVSTVALVDAPYSSPPAQGYHVTDVTITPGLVIISGDPVTIGKVRNIMLPPVSLAGLKSDSSFQVQIPYPDGVTGNVALATVKYFISQNPAVSPSP